MPNATLDAYFTSERYAAEHGDVVDRFVKAIGRSLRYAASHPDEARRIVAQKLKIPERTARRIGLPVWTPKMDETTVRPLADLAKRFAGLEEDVDLGKLLR